MYNTAAQIGEFCDRIISCAGRLTDSFEIVLVNDGSPDNSRDLAMRLVAADPRIVLVNAAAISAITRQ